MPTVFWDPAKSGNFTDPQNWVGGAPPLPTDDADIGGGVSFEVNVGPEKIQVHDVSFHGANATLTEAFGSRPLTIHTLDLSAGTIIFQSANHIGQIDLSGGTLEVDAKRALGTGPVEWTGGQLIARFSIPNRIDVSHTAHFYVGVDSKIAVPQLAVHSGAVVTLDGRGQFELIGDTALEDSSDYLGYDLDIAAGTKVTAGNQEGFALFSDALHVTLDGSFTPVGSVILNNLSGDGLIKGGPVLVPLFIQGVYGPHQTEFSGDIKGNIAPWASGFCSFTGELNQLAFGMYWAGSVLDISDATRSHKFGALPIYTGSALGTETVVVGPNMGEQFYDFGAGDTRVVIANSAATQTRVILKADEAAQTVDVKVIDTHLHKVLAHFGLGETKVVDIGYTEDAQGALTIVWGPNSRETPTADEHSHTLSEIAPDTLLDLGHNEISPAPNLVASDSAPLVVMPSDWSEPPTGDFI